FIPSPVAVGHWNIGAVGLQYGLTTEMLKKELGIEDTIYIEAVSDKDGSRSQSARIFDKTRIVQFRDGPAQEASTDFIPRTEEVKKWLQTNYSDLLAWERYIKKEIRENGGKP